LSSFLFLFELIAFLLVVRWITRVEREGPAAAEEGIFAMLSDDAPRGRSSSARGPRWKAVAKVAPAAIPPTLGQGDGHAASWRRRPHRSF
jgi:hypothetical protein